MKRNRDKLHELSSKELAELLVQGSRCMRRWCNYYNYELRTCNLDLDREETFEPDWLYICENGVEKWLDSSYNNYCSNYEVNMRGDAE